MYKIKFSNEMEIRMGSPYNVADIDIAGDFVPQLDDYEFQDKYALSSDEAICLLIQWSIQQNEPGFIVWKLSEKDQMLSKSDRFEGCCDNIEFKNGKVEVFFSKNGKTNVEEIEL